MREAGGSETDGLERVARLAGHAMMVVAYDDAIRGNPCLAAGFGRMRDRHSERLAALVGEICGAAGARNPQAAPIALGRAAAATRVR